MAMMPNATLGQPLDRATVIERIVAERQALRTLGVRNLYLFGSVARGEATVGSDIDVFFDFDDAKSYDLFDAVGVGLHLVEVFGCKVDAFPRTYLKPAIRARAEAEALPVFS